MFNNTTLLLILSFVAIFPWQKANAIETHTIAATRNIVEFSTSNGTANAEPQCDDRGSGRVNCYKTESQPFNKERGSGRIETDEQTYKKGLHH